MNFDNLILHYTTVLLEFLLELYVFYFLFTMRLTRKKYFYVRALVGMACVCAVAFGAAFFYEFFGNTVWGRISVYIFLFAVSVVQVKTCFSESVWTVLFCCDMSYAAQNLVYKVFLTVWCAGLQIGIFPVTGDFGELFYKLYYYGFMALTVLATYFLFVRRAHRHMSYRQLNIGMLVVSLVIMCITVLLCSLEDVYFGTLSYPEENMFTEPVYFALRQTGNVFSIVCCVCVLLLLTGTLEKRDLKQEIGYLQHAMRQSEKQYNISKDTIDLINVKCHDMRHKIKTLLSPGSSVSPETLEDLQEAISIYDANIQTGNKMLDVIMTEKSLYCEKNGITFSCMADGKKLSFMEEGDLYCLFGNIVENAVEAVLKLPEKEKRIINLVIKPKDNLLVIQSDNYYAGTLDFEDGLPVTTKSDKNYHGFGMKSIKMIVHKYGGEITASADGSIFHLNILLNVPNGDG